MSRPPGRWRRAVRHGWLLLVLVVVAVVVLDRWEEIAAELAGARPGWIAVAALLAVAGVGVSSLVWRAVLTGMGAPLGLAAGVPVVFVGQLGKYLPGSVWPLVAQAELGRDHAVPARASVAAVVVFLWTHLVTGAAVAALASAAAEVVPAATALLALPLLALLAPALLGRLLRLALRLLRRQPLAALPGLRAMGASAAWAALMWVLYGLHLAAIVAAFGHAADPVLAVAAFAAAWCAGFVFLVAPAGAGVREAAMVAVLASALPAAAALAAALLSRLLLTLADLAWALAGVAASAGARRDAGPRA